MTTQGFYVRFFPAKCKLLEDKDSAVFIFKSPSGSTQDLPQGRYFINVCLVNECVGPRMMPSLSTPLMSGLDGFDSPSHLGRDHGNSSVNSFPIPVCTCVSTGRQGIDSILHPLFHLPDYSHFLCCCAELSQTCGLKQYKFILLQSWKSGVRNQFRQAKDKETSGPVPLGGSEGRIPFFAFFSF